MRPREVVIRELVQQWLAKARQDLAVAERLLADEAPYVLSAVGFHAQQATEKYLKAFLVRHQVEFPKTHDIGEVLDLLATIDNALAQSLRAAQTLTPYGVEVRYPADAPELTAEQAREAVALASRVRDAVCAALRDYLPPT